ncbi:hypothetical protein Tco_1400934 [Tanacetum coccineum]
MEEVGEAKVELGEEESNLLDVEWSGSKTIVLGLKVSVVKEDVSKGSNIYYTLASGAAANRNFHFDSHTHRWLKKIGWRRGVFLGGVLNSKAVGNRGAVEQSKKQIAIRSEIARTRRWNVKRAMRLNNRITRSMSPLSRPDNLQSVLSHLFTWSFWINLIRRKRRELVSRDFFTAQEFRRVYWRRVTAEMKLE